MKYKITKADWKLLVATANPTGNTVTSGELSKILGISEIKVKARIKKLKASNLLIEIFGGPTRLTNVAVNFEIAPKMQNVISTLPTIDISAVLSGNKMATIVAFNGRARTKKKLMSDTRLSAPTMQRLLYALKNQGIVSYSKKKYSLRPEIEPINQLVETVYTAIGHKQIFQLFKKPEATITKGNIQLVAAGDENPPTGYFLTGLSRFSELGVNVLLTNRRYYCNFKPELNDVFVHSILFAVLFSPNGSVDSRTKQFLQDFYQKNRENLSLDRLLKQPTSEGGNLLETLLKRGNQSGWNLLVEIIKSADGGGAIATATI